MLKYRSSSGAKENKIRWYVCAHKYVHVGAQCFVSVAQKLTHLPKWQKVQTHGCYTT